MIKTLNIKTGKYELEPLRKIQKPYGHTLEERVIKLEKIVGNLLHPQPVPCYTNVTS